MSEPYFPIHPDPYVSESAACLIVAACESRSVGLVRHTITACAALACVNEVVTDLALHGAARLAALESDEVTIAPWHFHKVRTSDGEPVWTFDIDRDHLARMYRLSDRLGEEADDFDSVLAELHRTGRSLCTAANEYPDDGGQTAFIVGAERIREEVLAHWPADEDKRTTWAGIARLGMCVAEFAHLAWGNPVGFGHEADDEPED